MNSYTLPLCKRNFLFTLLATLVLPTISSAETYDFRVVYAEVPGINEILAGDHEAAIEILENGTKDPDNYGLSDELATLCALYVVKRRLVAARETCDRAVETDQSYTAYNNRGVLRVHLGDRAGAIEDFEHARVLPQNQKRYIQDLMKRDARLIATSNYAVAKRLAEKENRGQPWQALANSIRGASVENISD